MVSAEKQVGRLITEAIANGVEVQAAGHRPRGRVDGMQDTAGDGDDPAAIRLDQVRLVNPGLVVVRAGICRCRGRRSRKPARLQRACPPRLRQAPRRPGPPGMLCPPPTRRLRAGRRGRRWLRPPCAGQQAHRRSHERTSAAPDRTSRQCPDAPQTAWPRPCSPISPAGSPLQQRRPCSQGVVSCRFDGCDLARGSARAVTIAQQRHKSPTHGSRMASGCPAPPFPRCTYLQDRASTWAPTGPAVASHMC